MERLYKIKVSHRELKQNDIKELRNRLKERGFNLKVFGQLNLEEII